MRTVSWFSCGAASAVATLLVAEQQPDNFHAVYCRVREEHEDNLRFLDDFTRVTDIPVEIIENHEFDASIYKVFFNRKFIKNQYGAPCTMLLKKEMRKQYQRDSDIQVFGFTVEEQDRADRLLDANNEINEKFVLIDKGITKRECLSRIAHLGIELPVMYRLGYNNNNCVGCVKGGMGYWNQIRKDFPDAFMKMSLLERVIGHAVNKDKNGPVYLDELEPNRGNFKKDVPGDCGFMCEYANPK